MFINWNSLKYYEDSLNKPFRKQSKISNEDKGYDFHLNIPVPQPTSMTDAWFMREGLPKIAPL